MRDSKLVACASRAREAGGVSAVVATLFLLAALTLFAGAQSAARAQETGKPAASIVGAWQATLPTGLRVATLTVVPDGEGFGGAFVGYDYERSVDSQKPAEAAPPKVSTRSGSMLTGTRLAGDTFTFKVYIRHPSPPPGAPPGYEVSGEVRLLGGDAAELRLSAPHKPEPMLLKLTRE